MSWIVSKDNGKYMARFRLPNGRVLSKTFDRRRDAERWWRDTQAQAYLKADLDPTKMTLAEFVKEERTLIFAGKREGTVTRYELSLVNHILPTLGSMPLGAIDRLSVQRWAARLEAGGCESVRLHLAVLQRVFKVAMHLNMVLASPCTGTILQRKNTRTPMFLTVDEVRRLDGLIHPRYRAMVPLAGFGGLRLGEVSGLTAQHVDVPGSSVVIDRSYSSNNGKMIWTSPKTKAGFRRVRLPAYAMDLLQSHMATYPLGPDGMVFTNRDGRGVAPNCFSVHWKRAVTALGKPEMHFHDLRHTAISLWIMSRESPKIISAKAGHSNISMTYDRYGHLFPDYDDHSVDAIDAALFNADVNKDLDED